MSEVGMADVAGLVFPSKSCRYGMGGVFDWVEDEGFAIPCTECGPWRAIMR
jgi:hypothetical protein